MLTFEQVKTGARKGDIGWISVIIRPMAAIGKQPTLIPHNIYI